MDKRAKIRQALKDLNGPETVQVWRAIVKSVDGLTCTVDLLGTELEDVPDVKLRADDEATEGVLLVPRVGSLVYVSAIENAVDNLFVCMVSEVDQVEVVINKTTITADKGQLKAVRDKVELTLSEKVVIKQDQTTIELASGKVSVKNAGTSLKGLFDDLTSLLQNFQVICSQPGTPSASVFPTTVTAITQLKATVSQLLA